jgi:hypothetical protein
LSDAEARVFTETAAAVRPGHFVPNDAATLACYAQCVVKARAAAVDDPELWERLVRLQMALARSLRLTVQSRVDPRSLTRHPPPLTRPPWAFERVAD